MCYSKNLSLKSFLFGIISSLLLITYGDKNNLLVNKSIGYFYIFVSFMQFFEYLFWLDINCKKGYNKFAAYMAPLFNHFQPIVVLLLNYKYLESSNIVPLNILIILNIIYSLYVIIKYKEYIDQPKNLCIQTNDEGHLNWTWKKEFDNGYYRYYLIIMIINYINFIYDKNILLSFIISHIILGISYFNFKQNIGEFWCLMVTGVPLFNLIFQNLIK